MELKSPNDTINNNTETFSIELDNDTLLESLLHHPNLPDEIIFPLEYTVKLPGLPQQSAHFVSGTITKLLEGRGQRFPVHQALKFEKTLLAKVVAIDRLISHVAGKKYEMKGVEKDTTETEQYIEVIEKKLRSLADSIELEDMHLDLTTIWEPHTSFRPCSPLVPKERDPRSIICNLVFLDNSQSIDKIWTWLMTENVLPYLESHDLEIQFGQVLDIYDEIGILRQNQDENKNISESKFNINILDNDKNEQVMRNSNLQELDFNSQISNKSLNSPLTKVIHSNPSTYQPNSNNNHLTIVNIQTPAEIGQNTSDNSIANSVILEVDQMLAWHVNRLIAAIDDL